ncbi:MAG: hypothetical protein PHT32_04435, partial [Candidatus Omnitrophica bacterium]|nr:hypothetical protein [Candidatus Omnitrophota bacterium]
MIAKYLMKLGMIGLMLTVGACMAQVPATAAEQGLSGSDVATIVGAGILPNVSKEAVITDDESLTLRRISGSLKGSRIDLVRYLAVAAQDKGQPASIVVALGNAQNGAKLAAVLTFVPLSYDTTQGLAGTLTVTHCTYDQNGRIVRRYSTIKEYDANGVIIGQGQRTTNYSYDRDGRLLSKNDIKIIDGIVLIKYNATYSYNQAGQLLTWRVSNIRRGDDGQLRSSYTSNNTNRYDSQGRLIGEEQVMENIYYENGMPVQTDKNEQVHTWVYDDNGNLLNEFFDQKNYVNGRLDNGYEESSEYTYDANGRLLASHRLTKNYMSGQLQREEEQWIERAYAENGNLTMNHERGRYQTYFDPTWDRLETWTYGVVNGIDRLLGTHYSYKLWNSSNWTDNLSSEEERTNTWEYYDNGSLLKETSHERYAQYNANDAVNPYELREEESVKEYGRDGQLVYNHVHTNNVVGGQYRQEYERTDTVAYFKMGKIETSHVRNATYYDWYQGGQEPYSQYEENTYNKYNMMGKLIYSHRSSTNVMNGQLQREEDVETWYTYDSQYRLTERREKGKTFVYFDPTWDRLETWTYGLVNGINTLLGTHFSYKLWNSDNWTDNLSNEEERTNTWEYYADGKVKQETSYTKYAYYAPYDPTNPCDMNETSSIKTYDAMGNLVYSHLYSKRILYGQLQMEEESTMTCAYDEQNRLTEKHEWGKYTVYFDPTWDRLETWTYGLVNGIDRLLGTHFSYKLWNSDNWQDNLSQEEERTTTYTYNNNGDLESVVTYERTANYDQNGNVGYERIKDGYTTYVDGIIRDKNETVYAFQGWDLVSMETYTEHYNASGKLEMAERFLYNGQGELYYHYLETAGYSADGTMLTRHIDEQKNKGEYYSYVRTVNESYSETGILLYRIEEETQAEGGMVTSYSRLIEQRNQNGNLVYRDTIKERINESYSRSTETIDYFADGETVESRHVEETSRQDFSGWYNGSHEYDSVYTYITDTRYNEQGTQIYFREEKSLMIGGSVNWSSVYLEERNGQGGITLSSYDYVSAGYQSHITDITSYYDDGVTVRNRVSTTNNVGGGWNGDNFYNSRRETNYDQQGRVVYEHETTESRQDFWFWRWPRYNMTTDKDNANTFTYCYPGYPVNYYSHTEREGSYEYTGNQLTRSVVSTHEYNEAGECTMSLTT